MRRFTSIHEITSSDLMELLTNWQEGSSSRREIFELAEELYYSDSRTGFPEVLEGDPHYAVVVVLELLEKMYINPTNEKDIPALKRFLKKCDVDIHEASRELDEYWENVDFEKRLSNT